ncbi:MarR family winged helix-turn-helix transcriptional regulator [Salimicrobium halophilum]|uniref:DNA-binding transcriptional regulator, MarR family n=1 Tax=Salimicrobium halophilum TaxID=86666 RepID=A0A1G8VES3_9BACI|nr:MarR family transcriptional regulator [Salimicrobium halophilum]SDJ64592.1 DNA-binding transcriptional regulator, MarR family [Salimicrobium halophilum]
MADEWIEKMEIDLRYVSAGVKDKGREILEDYDISPPQFVALQWVSDQREITIGRIAKHMHLAHSTTTDMIDRLEALGFVERKKDEKDRRVVRVYIKRSGERVIQEVIEKRRTYLEELLEGLSNEEKQQFGVLLGHMHEKMMQLTN